MFPPLFHLGISSDVGFRVLLSMIAIGRARWDGTHVAKTNSTVYVFLRTWYVSLNDSYPSALQLSCFMHMLSTSGDTVDTVSYRLGILMEHAINNNFMNASACIVLRQQQQHYCCHRTQLHTQRPTIGVLKERLPAATSFRPTGPSLTNPFEHRGQRAQQSKLTAV
jgi:hypothetical protein